MLMNKYHFWRNATEYTSEKHELDKVAVFEILTEKNTCHDLSPLEKDGKLSLESASMPPREILFKS